MATELKLRKGTTAEHSTFTGAEAEVTFDTDKNTVVAHDGTTAGGYPLAKENKISEGNSSIEVIDSGTGRIEFTVDGSEAMRINENGNVGIGESSPLYPFDVDVPRTDNFDSYEDIFFTGMTTAGGLSGQAFRTTISTNRKFSLQAHPSDSAQANAFAVLAINKDGGNVGIGTDDPPEKLSVNGNIAFDSGFGSVATAYGCRAWVNFNGTGTVSIRDSGNVSSITDSGIGDYTVNFTTAMPDVNYSPICSSYSCLTNSGRPGQFIGARGGSIDPANPQGRLSTGSVVIGSSKPASNAAGGGPADSDGVYIAIFR